MALVWLFENTTKRNSRKIERWKVSLLDYTYDVTHKKGKTHVNADALSRLPRIIDVPNES